MNGTALVIMLCTIIPVNILLAFTPYMTRRTEIFGVTVGAEYAELDTFKKMRRSYAWLSSIVMLLFLLVFIVVSFKVSLLNQHSDTLFALLIILQLAAAAGIYLVYHKKMNRLKAEQPEWFRKQERLKISTDFRSRKLTVSNLWFMIPFLIAIITIVFTYIFYGQIPKQIPMQYNFAGETVEWANKTYRSVFMLPAVQLFLICLFLFVNQIIRSAKQQIEGYNPEAAQQRNIIFRRRWSVFLLFMAIMLTAMFAVFQASLIWEMPGKLLLLLPFLFTLVVIVGCAILAITTGQGGSRVKIDGETASGTPFDGRDEDQYWKLGVFYFNKNDPSIFVEKRFGIGWTNNWAHPLSWIFIIVIIVLAVGLPLFFAL